MGKDGKAFKKHVTKDNAQNNAVITTHPIVNFPEREMCSVLSDEGRIVF